MRVKRLLQIRHGGAVLLLVAAFLLGGCQEAGEPRPGPTASDGKPETAAWESDLTEDQIDTAYEAIDFLHAYDAKIEQFVEEGKATPEALEYLQDSNAVWTLVWEGLQANEAEGRTSVKEPGWDATTTPTEVSVQPDGYALVTITRCLDPSKTTDYVNGIEQARPLVPSYEQYESPRRVWRVGLVAQPVGVSRFLAA